MIEQASQNSPQADELFKIREERDQIGTQTNQLENETAKFIL
jgi:hypothetical protein